MRILLTTEYKMVWLNLAYNMVDHVTVMDKKLLTKTRLLGYIMVGCFLLFELRLRAI